MLATLPPTCYEDREAFLQALDAALENWNAAHALDGARQVNLSAPLRKAVLDALSERDESAEICRDRHGHPEPDPALRDTERVPLDEDVDAYFEREVRPHVPDAWVDRSTRDPKDGKVGKVGYEINFNRYFYQYQPPRPLEEIEADIRALETEILAMLGEVAG
jgi:type I restriction enzyme M protein